MNQLEITTYHCNHVGASALQTVFTTTILRPFFQDHPGEPVQEENF